MKQMHLLPVAAVAALALVAGCSKNNGAGGSATDTSGNATTTAAADNTSGANTTGTPSATGVAPSKTVNNVQDAAAGPVGMLSASTLGSHDTGAFVANAAMSDMYEVQAAQVAEQNSQSPAVKKFARMMVQDHSKTTKQLTGLVAKDAIKTQIPTTLDQRRNGMLDNLKAYKGKDFDDRYAKQQVAAHKEALALLQGYAKSGDNADLKQWAATTAPKVQEHLSMAQQLPGAAGDAGAAGQ